MVVILATVSGFLGFLLLLFTLVLLFRNVTHGRAWWLSRRAWGAISLLAAGVALMWGGRPHAISRLWEEQTKWKHVQAAYEGPLETLRLVVNGPDPFSVQPGACRLQVRMTAQDGSGFLSEVRDRQLHVLERPTDNAQAYALTWQALVAGARTAEDKKTVTAITSAQVLRWYISSLELTLLLPATMADSTPDSLELWVLQPGHEPLGIFLGQRTLPEMVPGERMQQLVYRDTNAAPASMINSWMTTHAQPLHQLSRELAAFVALGLFLLAVGVALRPLQDVCLSRARSESSRAESGSHLQAFLVFGLVLGLSLFGEKIPVSDGLGWDGQVYAAWVRDFHGQVLEGGQDLYYVQRTLPSAILHYALRFLSVPPTNENIVAAFGVLNALLLTLMAYTWGAVAEQLGIGRTGKWLGFFGLFVNFAVLKMAPYYAVLTDVPAYALALLMLLCYLKRNPLALGALMVLGSFTWPTLVYQGAALLLFPRENAPGTPASPPPYRLHMVLAALAAGGIYALLVYAVLMGVPFPYPRTSGEVYRFLARHGLTLDERTFTILELAVLSAGLSTLFFFLALRELGNCGRLFEVRRWLTRIGSASFLAALLFTVSLKFLSAACAQAVTLDSGLLYAVTTTLLDSIRWPGVFLIAHVGYFGPLVLLGLFHWAAVCRFLWQYGPGVPLATALGLLLSLDSESRHGLPGYPLLVPFIVKALEQSPWRAWQVWLLGLLSLALSKVWLPFGVREEDFSALETWEQFPAQAYFMNLGPWMSWEMYCLQGAVVVVVGGLLYLLPRSVRRHPTEPEA